jgi:predicted oxidoreductase (fatty acid repression mutant protein)
MVAINVTARHGQPPNQGLSTLLKRRRSIRRLRGGPLEMEMLDRIAEAAHLTPSAYNRPPWHIVVIHERLDAFWAMVEAAFREQLDGDRLARYLDRLQGFRAGVATVLIYEDRSIGDELETAWRISEDEARAFCEQALGMVQLTLWLAVVEEGLATSLQHWEALIEGPLAAFLDLPADRYRLTAAMPIGYPAEEPRSVARPESDHVFSLDSFRGGE